MQSLAEISPTVLKKLKMWKDYRQTDRQADRQDKGLNSEKFNWTLYSGKLKQYD